MQKQHNKLVRDKIPTLLENLHITFSTYICDETEYQKRLRDKLQEEVTEFLTDNTIEELTDILEVIYALARTKGVTKNELELLRKEKAFKRGKFKKRIILLETK